MIGRWRFIDKARGFHGPLIWVCFPHTSKWDAVVTLASGWVWRNSLLMLVKDTEFGGVQGALLRKAGCFPLDTRGGQGMVDRVLARWSLAPERSLALSPEGRLEAVPYWRTGYYVLSLVTGIPVTYCWCDYPARTITREPPVWLTGVPSRDLAWAQRVLSRAVGRHQAKVGPIQFKPEWSIDEARMEQQREFWRKALTPRAAAPETKSRPGYSANP